MARIRYTVDAPRMPVFTDRFRALVDAQGGVSEVVRLTKISRPTISFWYNGQRTPDAEHLIILARTFNVSADYLLGIDNETLLSKADFLKKELFIMKEDLNTIIDTFLSEAYDPSTSD